MPRSQEAKTYAIEQATAALKQLLKGEKVRRARARALSQRGARLRALTYVERHSRESQDHFKDVAQVLKADLDLKFPNPEGPGTWHVVVGKHFGSFVTHEIRKCDESPLPRHTSELTPPHLSASPPLWRARAVSSTSSSVK